MNALPWLYVVAVALVVVSVGQARAATTLQGSAMQAGVPARAAAAGGSSEGRGSAQEPGSSVGASASRSPIDAATAAHAAAVQGVKPPSLSAAGSVPGMNPGSPLMTREAYDLERDRIDATFEADIDRCSGLHGNARDVCRAQAGAQRKVARAELDARLKNTDRAAYQVRLARIESEYEVARQRCGEHSGNARDSCLREARETVNKAKAEAKSDRPGRSKTHAPS